MTTGFQQQQYNYTPMPRSVARPQQVGSKLPNTREHGFTLPTEPRSFRESRLND